MAKSQTNKNEYAPEINDFRGISLYDAVSVPIGRLSQQIVVY
jgi:hypothetical protein